MTTKLSGCPICAVLENQESQVVCTGCWDVRLAHQQMRPGRCMTVLRRHAETETSLTEQEWLDLRNLRQMLHPAIQRAFGASHLNTCLLMNGAFKNYGATHWGRSHVHYWDVPRYRSQVMIGDMVFEDPSYPQCNPGEFGEDMKDVPQHVRAAIIKAIQTHL